MKPALWIVTVLFIVVSVVVVGYTEIGPTDQSNDNALASQPVDDADAYLRRQMESHWSSPERKTWRIEYRTIEGLEDRLSWHIQGTHWWVRIYPEVFKLDDLDKKSVYEIDAVALNQNYGMIDFYVYNHPQKISR